MEVVRFRQLDQLDAHAAAWDRLADSVPFRSHCWQAIWWRHYGTPDDLFVLGLFEAGNLVAVAPWYRAASVKHGRTLRFLGDGEVCSEYSTVLCRPDRRAEVVDALADWLIENEGRDRWDTLELTSVDCDDPLPAALARRMAEFGCRLHARPGDACWRIPLPPTWDEYVRPMSKDHRKKLRRMCRDYVDGGRARWHTATTPDQLATAQEILIQLHQRRHDSLGHAGCFSWPRYRAFHHEVQQSLLARSQLGLHWVELDGRPIAAEYHLLGGNVVYVYQGGIEPEAARVSPGQIATLFALRSAIKRGDQGFDFLRGDEPYKRHWHAEPRPTVEFRVVADRAAARMRHGTWLAGLEIKHWVKGTLESLHLR